jgi:lysophospholipase L1-like esterase
MGDSLTSGYADPGPAWPARLDTLDANLKLLNNAGIPGNTTAQMLARFGSEVLDYKPSMVFILGGTNDPAHGISQAGTIANLKAMILKAKAANIRPFLMMIPPNSSTGYASEIDSLNAAILHLGNANTVVVIDIHSPLSTSTGVYQSKYTVDGLHFSSLGAATVASTVYARVHRLGY